MAIPFAPGAVLAHLGPVWAEFCTPEGFHIAPKGTEGRPPNGLFSKLGKGVIDPIGRAHTKAWESSYGIPNHYGRIISNVSQRWSILLIPVVKANRHQQ